MAAAVSQGVHSWTVSSSTKAVKLNRFHLFFTYISTSFSSSEEHPCFSGPNRNSEPSRN